MTSRPMALTEVFLRFAQRFNGAQEPGMVCGQQRLCAGYGQVSPGGVGMVGNLPVHAELLFKFSQAFTQDRQKVGGGQMLHEHQGNVSCRAHGRGSSQVLGQKMLEVMLTFFREPVHRAAGALSLLFNAALHETVLFQAIQKLVSRGFLQFDDVVQITFDEVVQFLSITILRVP